MNESHIGVNSKGECTSFVGADAVNYVRAEILASSIRLTGRSGILPTRGMTLTKMLTIATGYTGKKYKRAEWELAASDVQKWAKEMKAALPVVQDAPARATTK